MSEIKLNIIDTQQVLTGTIHASVSDVCVAALSAEPENIAELISALGRYNKRLEDCSPFATFHASSVASSAPLDVTPWDAGLVVIDLAARIVASESTCSMPGPSGRINYHDGAASTELVLRYRLPDDWLFVNSVEAYQWSRERRTGERVAQTPLDVREVLYGTPLLAFIAEECGRVNLAQTATVSDAPDPDESDSTQTALLSEISAIHARWLMTPRDDLRRRSPRDVMIEKQDLIDFDLETRSLQWSFLDEGPPCLSPDSFAYRFAGFGTHEWVIYYDLVRHLLWSALNSRLDGSPHAGGEKLFARLEELKTNWLEQPQADYDGRIPAILIDNERRRLPIALRPRDMIIDEDCPVCQMFGDETTLLGMGVGFWHLDGCNMDDDFAFSSYKTLEEWETENRRQEEFHKEFTRRWEERQQRIARGQTLEPDPFFDPDPFPGLAFEDSNPISRTEDDKEFSQ